MNPGWNVGSASWEWDCGIVEQWASEHQRALKNDSVIELNLLISVKSEYRKK